MKTHLASPVVVHPTALLVEAERLADVGESNALSRLSVDPMCRVTTPFQQAAGRLRELQRAGKRHGSCGVGVGETVSDSLAQPELTLHFGELSRPELARAKLARQRALKLNEFAHLISNATHPDVARELALLGDSTVADRWLSRASEVAASVRLMADEGLSAVKGPIVFEGAQGVLLDEQVGFHPFTTYSRCTPHAAHRLLSRIGWSYPVETIGVLRAYGVRHGPGPLPTEDPFVAEKTSERHNGTGAWQGPVRKGWLDLQLLDYALRACGGVDALAITHLDSLDLLQPYRWSDRYASPITLELPCDLSEQEQLTNALLSAEPRYTSLAGATAEALCDALSEQARIPVRYGSVGPSSSAVFER